MSKEVNSSEREEATRNCSKSAAPLELVVDKSSAKIGIWHYVAVYIWIGWFNLYLMLITVLPLSLWLCPFLWRYVQLPLTIFFGVLLISAVYPLEDKYQPEWGIKLGRWLMNQAESYFQLRIFCEDFKAVLKAQPGIFCMEPHDILPVSIFAFSSYLNGGQGYLPTHRMQGCMASICFLIPGMRHIYTWVCATTVGRKNMQRLLDRERSPGLFPGGVQEVTLITTENSNKECILFLKSRLGVVKLAAENGVPLIPSFTFNQRDVFGFYIPNNPIMHWVGRRIGFLPMMYFGVLNAPYGIPKPRPLTVVIGSPIDIPKMEAPFTEEKLKPYHDQLLAAYRRIFESHREKFGMGHITLKIV